MRVARIPGAAAPENRSDRELQPLTRTCNAVIALPSIATISDPVAAERSPRCGTFAAAGHCLYPASTMAYWARSHAAQCQPSGAIRVQHDRGRQAWHCTAASTRGGPSQRHILSAKCIPGILRACCVVRRGYTSVAGTLCASQRLARSGKGHETSPDRCENNEKAKAKRKRFALRYLRPMMCPPWNKPKAIRLAWQARRSPLLGRRTGAERLYSDDGHRGGARLAMFARTRIRGFEEVLRARDGRA
jgi:hypothetical protein